MSNRCHLALFEHSEPCPDPNHREALLRRAGRGKWSPILRTEGVGGWRDFLDGRPIHCGDFLELQAVRIEDDDYGDYTVFLDSGRVVRYEANLSSADGAIVLCISISGCEFRARHEPWMRFRWPKS